MGASVPPCIEAGPADGVCTQISSQMPLFGIVSLGQAL